ncbi:MAG: bifunctional glutamate N-acetyltransferase/amino-acid acetyltransferase ArgJ [Proteobacteria bacterium]|nr:bifunctional glutamate N-acetyltransferase/amino-acid acetyltransferase ArgJ [Pseudomonadota bacterium]MDA0845049.1 bifunctional glutamate N-acetyltransferase/amino-acid acetyltransferase ArgJ [Pseudomonadota bacterium]
MTIRSPLAPDKFPNLPAIDGLGLAVAASGLKYKNRDDLLLMTLCETATVAGVFTRSDTVAAPVIWSRDVVASGRARAILTNAGNANAFTGERGRDTVHQTSTALAGALGFSADQILLASTGVIGEPLESTKLSAYFPQLVANQGASWEQAAGAILTTDTFAKGAHVSCDIDGVAVNICGIAKGSGMIAPNMATMLGYIATDAALPTDILQALLTTATDHSFNAITVDSDTSTNDTVFLIATGRAKTAMITSADDPKLAGFRDALTKLMVDLATQIVRDGEGASKFITIGVSGAESDHQARHIGLAIANSPLVKTAIAGEDANWGRIVMAVGKSGFGIDQQAIGIKIGGFPVAANGMRVTDYDETPIAAHMQTASIDIAVSVGAGAGVATVYSCDLTHGYISINADYRS